MTIANSERVEKAAEPSAVSRRIFRNFRDATIALLDCDDLPEDVGKAVDHMLDYFNNELGGADEDPIDNARRVMSNVFELNEEEGTKETPVSHHKEIRAEGFTLVDEAGGVRARLCVVGNDAVLAMRDSKGRPRLRIRAGDKEATITICGERGEAGKGVLPADDEVERVTIGYDSAEQDARIVIKDGNENKRVTLSLDGDGAGAVWVESGDGCACIYERGMVILDSDNELLATYQAPEEAKDRPAAAAAPEPARDANIEMPKADPAPERQAERHVETENRFGSFLKPDRSRSAISQEAVRDLVERIIPRDDDEAVKAFVALIDRIAYDTDQVTRDGLALHACEAAYQRTRAFSDVAEKFFDEAAAEAGLRAS